MISHKHKCIFIHIPKAAGTSVEKFLRQVDPEIPSKVLRKIFPRYYLLILLISLISSLISFLWFEQIDLYMALSISILAFIGYAIIPITNFARDRGWNSLFKWMHNLSVANTIIILLISLTQLVRIINS